MNLLATVYVASISNGQCENRKLIVVNVAYEAVIAHPISPLTTPASGKPFLV